MGVIAIRVLLNLQTIVSLVFSLASMSTAGWTKEGGMLDFINLPTVSVKMQAVVSLIIVAGGSNLLSLFIAVMDLIVTRRSSYKSGVTFLSCLSAFFCVVTTVAWVCGLTLWNRLITYNINEPYSFWLGAIAAVANFQLILVHFALVSQRRTF